VSVDESLTIWNGHLPAEITSIKLKRGQHVSVYKDRQTVMKWNTKKDICLVITIHDNKMVSTRVLEQHMENLKVVIDYNSRMGISVKWNIGQKFYLSQRVIYSAVESGC
jgi:D-Tyr-tRNAtyr deacylase